MKYEKKSLKDLEVGDEFCRRDPTSVVEAVEVEKVLGQIDGWTAVKCDCFSIPALCLNEVEVYVKVTAYWPEISKPYDFIRFLESDDSGWILKGDVYMRTSAGFIHCEGGAGFVATSPVAERSRSLACEVVKPTFHSI